MSSPEPDRRQLTLLDATCIMLGIVVGSGIFRTPADVASHCPNALILIGVWLAGGIASLLGALCFAELSTRYPEHGGTYAFLNRAYGSWAGLLFAWTDFWIVRPANAGAVAIVLGNYANAALPWPYFGAAGYAVAAVLLATATHLIGLRASR
jgi:basic amino acid/polyamine antiporter, APA family